MMTHYKELYEVALGQLKFEKLCVAHLKSVLDEVHELGDEITKAVIENAINRHNLDKIIHVKKIFGDNPDTLTEKK